MTEQEQLIRTIHNLVRKPIREARKGMTKPSRRQAAQRVMVIQVRRFLREELATRHNGPADLRMTCLYLRRAIRALPRSR